jgi:ATP-dependent protease ClpP protease subunit
MRKRVLNNTALLTSNVSFLNVVNTEGGGKNGEIWLSGFVGDEWSDTGVSMKNLKNYVVDNGLTKCTIYLNTGGGYVSSAMEFVAYMQLSKNTTFKVVNVGIVASAGVLILVGADKSEAVDGTLTMIHDPSLDNWGSMKSKDMRKSADVLDLIKNSIVSVYLNKMKKMGKVTNENENEVKTALGSMMENETWMDATQAKELGFVNNVIESGKVKKDSVSNETNFQIVNSLNFKNYQKMSGITGLLNDLLGKKPKVETKKEGVDDNIKNALEVLKKAGFEVEGEDDEKKVEEVDEVTAALNLLKSKGYKIATGKDEDKKEDEKKVEEKKPENAVDDKLSKLEALVVEMAKNFGEGKKELDERKGRKILMPSLNYNGGSKAKSGDDDEEEDVKGKPSVFKTIKNGTEIEQKMKSLAEAFRS